MPSIPLQFAGLPDKPGLTGSVTWLTIGHFVATQRK
jgi:hypothetical protein